MLVLPASISASVRVTRTKFSGYTNFMRDSLNLGRQLPRSRQSRSSEVKFSDCSWPILPLMISASMRDALTKFSVCTNSMMNFLNAVQQYPRSRRSRSNEVKFSDGYILFSPHDLSCYQRYANKNFQDTYTNSMRNFLNQVSNFLGQVSQGQARSNFLIVKCPFCPLWSPFQVGLWTKFSGCTNCMMNS